MGRCAQLTAISHQPPATSPPPGIVTFDRVSAAREHYDGYEAARPVGEVHLDI
jgi:hypothetical protein